MSSEFEKKLLSLLTEINENLVSIELNLSAVRRESEKASRRTKSP